MGGWRTGREKMQDSKEKGRNGTGAGGRSLIKKENGRGKSQHKTFRTPRLGLLRQRKRR